MKELEELKKLIEGGSKFGNISDWKRLKKFFEDAKEEFTEEERKEIERYLKLTYKIMPKFILAFIVINALIMISFGLVIFTFALSDSSLPDIIFFKILPLYVIVDFLIFGILALYLGYKWVEIRYLIAERILGGKKDKKDKTKN